MRKAIRFLLFLPVVLSSAYQRMIARIRPGLGALMGDRAYADSHSLTRDVSHQTPSGEVRMTFYTPNEVCRYRAETFTTKEPETLQWIDSFGNDGVLYDIGANVGLYSVYFGLTHGGMTFAFEPSVFNVALLAKNNSANGLSDRVVIVPIPLTEANEIASFNMTSTDEGGALSTFGQGFGHDGQPIQPVMRYMTMGFSLDFLREVGAIQHPPTLIKIDVDGIEHLILRGAIETLKSPTLKSILIEVNDDFLEQALHVDRILQGAGFVRKEKTHSDMAELGAFGHTYNQIWLRA